MARLRGKSGEWLRLAAPSADGTVLEQQGFSLNHSFAEQKDTLKQRDHIIALFDELQDPVFRYLTCLGFRPADADEIVQESFLRLCAQVRQGGRIESPRGWVFRVAHNVAMNRVRDERHAPEALPEDWEEGTEKQQCAPNPEEILLQKERMDRVHGAIERLPMLQKQCLFLRVEGLQYREIAETLNLAVTTVGECLRRAIGKLAGEFHE
jgi:RNA polymerase sigma-70 factor (ECF subfamily)